MATDPERPIERLLRDCARKRRDEGSAPFELHPATRRLLQGEVAKQFARKENTGPLKFFLRPWAGLAWGLAATAVLLIAAFIVFAPLHEARKEQLMAKSERPAESVSPAQAAPEAENRLDNLRRQTAATRTEAQQTLQQEPARALSIKDLAANAPADQDASRLALQPAPEPVTSPPSSSTAGATLLADNAGAPQNGALARRYGLDRGVPRGAVASAPSTVVPLPAPPAASPVSAAGQSDFRLAKSTDGLAADKLTGVPEASFAAVATGVESPRLSQDFVRTAPMVNGEERVRSKASPGNSVLVSFKLEQTGEQLRVVDQDGSVYSGYLQNSEVPSLNSAVRAKSAFAPNDKKQPTDTLLAGAKTLPTPPTYFFRVTGTNKSLNQKVVFTGSLVPTNMVVSIRTTNAVGARFGGNLNAVPDDGRRWLLNSKLSGKALIGDRQQIDINAAPAK